ncbi:MAG: hypothetical protein JWP33_1986 [Blastococcus sp.]|nr:hypothetical protein [Blastococcus sp.]
MAIGSVRTTVSRRIDVQARAVNPTARVLHGLAGAQTTATQARSAC